MKRLFTDWFPLFTDYHGLPGDFVVTLFVTFRHISKINKKPNPSQEAKNTKSHEIKHPNFEFRCTLPDAFNFRSANQHIN